MKSKNFQKTAFSMYQNSDTLTKIYHDFNDGIPLGALERWCQMVRRSGSITFSSPPGCSRLIRTKENSQKAKGRLRLKKRASVQRPLVQFEISRTNVRRIMKNGLCLSPYKIVSESLLPDDHTRKN